MIDRYASKYMIDLFSDESRFNTYLEVEIACLEGYAKLGIIPHSDVNKIKEKAKVDVNKIKELENITHHDVVAFTRSIDAYLGEEKRWFHFGLTSTDIVDTSLSILYKKANEQILDKLYKLQDALKNKAIKYKYTPCIGRSHGMHAEVTSFGLKWALYYDEFNRDIERFILASKQLQACKISGSVGNFANVPYQVQDYVANKFGLENTKISTQVLQRDRHSYYACILAIIASTIEKICVEIRNLSRSEIQEVEEGFSKGQKGSSSMPQKRNPIGSENLCGCARMMLGYQVAILQDNPLYHERDISHSSVERVAFIDMIEMMDYMLNRMTSIINNLNVFENNMLKNIDITYESIYSQQVMTKMILKGCSREEAYDLIQPLAMKSILEKVKFSTLIKNSPSVRNLFLDEELNDIFKFDYYLKNINEIYKRVGLD